MHSDLSNALDSDAAKQRHESDKDQGAEMSPQGLADLILKECQSVLEMHEKLPFEAFNDDQNFRGVTEDMLDTVLWGKQKLKLWLADPRVDVWQLTSLSLRNCHRKWVEFVRSQGLESVAGATEYLQARGREFGPKNQVNSAGEPWLVSAAIDGGWDSREMNALITASGPGLNPKALFGAAQSGNLEWLEALLLAGADHTVRNSYKVTPLHSAAENNHADCVRVLVAKGDILNAQSDRGVTALHLAAKNGHSKCVKLLVDAQADSSLSDSAGATPLWYAACNGHVECVTLLIGIGDVALKADNAGFTPLAVSAMNGHVECVRLLIGAGADINKSTTCLSPLYLACRSGHAECAKALISAGAELDSTNIAGTTPLAIAVRNANETCVLALIEAGADVNKCDNDGTSPVLIATQNGCAACVHMLVAATADVQMSNDDNVSPLGVAVANSNIECAQVLVKTYPGGGIDFLCDAAQKGQTELAQFLVEAGIDVDGCDSRGLCPVDFAAMAGKEECLKLLLALGADPNNPKSYDSPLSFATNSNSVECVRILLTAGAAIPNLDRHDHAVFFAMCDKSQENLEFGNWWHKLGTNEDLSDASWRAASAEEQLSYKKIDKSGDLGPDACVYSLPHHPLLVACWNGYELALQEMLKAGIRDTSYRGWTGLQIAEFRRQQKCVALLKQYSRV
eukprot:c16760_g1_i2.p1 GENE.c16760_g1_i2~~c16760_g1_i2.p1  ORF type:complete len:682 (+),score=144.69 c16760_g1_i2:597-2642(+)